MTVQTLHDFESAVKAAIFYAYLQRGNCCEYQTRAHLTTEASELGLTFRVRWGDTAGMRPDKDRVFQPPSIPKQL